MRNQSFRIATVKLLRRILTPLMEIGVLSRDEYELLFSYISSLAQKGVPPQQVSQKLITAKEAAELLGISFSEFRKLEAAKTFPFHRRTIGKNVRYLNTDLIEYMLTGSVSQ